MLFLLTVIHFWGDIPSQLKLPHVQRIATKALVGHPKLVLFTKGPRFESLSDHSDKVSDPRITPQNAPKHSGLGITP